MILIDQQKLIKMITDVRPHTPAHGNLDHLIFPIGRNGEHPSNYDRLLSEHWPELTRETLMGPGTVRTKRIGNIQLHAVVCYQNDNWTGCAEYLRQGLDRLDVAYHERTGLDILKDELKVDGVLFIAGAARSKKRVVVYWY